MTELVWFNIAINTHSTSFTPLSASLTIRVTPIPSNHYLLFTVIHSVTRFYLQTIHILDHNLLPCFSGPTSLTNATCKNKLQLKQPKTNTTKIINNNNNESFCRDSMLSCCTSSLGVMTTRTFSRPASLTCLAFNPRDLYYRGY